jgi:hypothetical protein
LCGIVAPESLRAFQTGSHQPDEEPFSCSRSFAEARLPSVQRDSEED